MCRKFSSTISQVQICSSTYCFGAQVLEFDLRMPEGCHDLLMTSPTAVLDDAEVRKRYSRLPFIAVNVYCHSKLPVPIWQSMIVGPALIPLIANFRSHCVGS